MKRIFIFLISLMLMAINGYCHQGHESEDKKLDAALARMLDAKLSDYFKAIERESADVKKGECDFLIQTGTDSLMRQHIALVAFRHYRDSRFMGDEAVAIHLYDTWFASGKVVMPDDNERLAAMVFAEFNRQSQIGCEAPELTMPDVEGNLVCVNDANGQDRFKVLYFYDTSCATCRVQTAMLDRLMSEEDFPIDLYAVYASDNESAWKSYIADNFKTGYGSERIYHLWDPDIESDFQRKYGVIQTPRIFLISPKGMIKGRGLDASALSLLLQQIFDDTELIYGSAESAALYDSIFDFDAPAGKDVCDVIDYVAEGTLEEGERTLFRQMTGDMLYYLSLKREEGFKEGLDYLIDTYILSRGDVWKSQDDSLKVIGMAKVYDDLLSRSEPGKILPDLKVPGELIDGRKTRKGDFRLDKLKGERNIVIFYTDGCNVCAAEKKAAGELVKADRKLKVLLVNVDDILLSSPQLSARLFDSFDLSTLPFILQTDRKGRIVRRYISLVK